MKIVDAHCDTLVKLMESGESLAKNSGPIDLQKLEVYDEAVIFFAIWLSDSKLDTPFRRTAGAISFFNELCAAMDKKISPILSLEGGEALEGSIENLYAFHEMGVKALTLTWNRRNELGDGTSVQNPQGLTDFGRDVVCEMERLGMLVDVSHLAQPGFWDVVEITKKPVIASHSNCFNICPHLRNLTDEQIRAIAQKNGVIGVNLYPPFLQKGGYANAETVLAHINHLIKTGGENCVGIGTDFDGIDSTPKGLEDISRLIILWELIAKHHGQRIADKIFYENMISVAQKLL